MSTRIMKQPSLGSRRHQQDEEQPEFNFSDWGLKAKITRENTNSRRFSASYITSFREEYANKSFRSNLTISSTASSPGYNLKEEIDPSTYSFTTALKALQAKTVYSWEYMSPEGLALNSKWDEAEKYICNPLSGEVPMECLSAKTLSGRSFRQLTSRITMSAPLIFPARPAAPAKPPMPPPLEINQPHSPIPTQEKKIGVTRDVGTQSTPPPPDLGSSSSPSPAPTPSIEERSINRHASESPSSCAKPKSEEEQEEEEEETTEELKSGTREEEEVTGRDELEEKAKAEKEKEKVRSSRQGGCLSWRSFLWMRKRQRRREKHRPRKKNNIFLCPIHEC
ncbi:PREDICTED: junctional sarcoplasmic reticulum protein 1-like [Ipomoea nil]|uniref:junctional sarcoplasmic reticulum protein 1-like n=1 Tax=Ipomoea nil TaxID=35883 RepID=UPI000901769D|nr:PREDICTED: junctional sarcoplasmic reticulum protein 1-like [Ipomoea nil]